MNAFWKHTFGAHSLASWMSVLCKLLAVNETRGAGGGDLGPGVRTSGQTGRSALRGERDIFGRADV